MRKLRFSFGQQAALACAIVALGGLSATTAIAQDPENCLSCHRFRGLSRLDPNTNELRLFFCSAEYYAYRQGPHARVRCTLCHKREEVEVVPHNVQTRVDCTNTCHIAPATGTALRFSHQRPAESLSHSVHSPERLAELHFDPPLLHEGQSTCLYCHDQPSFGTNYRAPEGFESHSGGTRCDTCHTEDIPLEIDYFAKHVAARMSPARSVRQLAQVCAVCHSDPQILEQIGGHDAVASYLHSFHGKASLLGSTETATCVECHSPESGDQHLMLAADDPESSINPVNLPDTCRTVECHPGAPPEMSSAAVHLELDPSQRTPEFYVAAFFIIMTAGVMAVFFLLVIMELLNAAVRRVDPEHRRMVRLARLLQANPLTRQKLQRMSVHERLQHWVLAISFTLLVLTGMPIKFAEAHWAQLFVDVFGGLTIARGIHRIAGVVLIAIFFYHIGYLISRLMHQRRRDREIGEQKPLYKYILGYPLLLTPKDAVHFVQLVGHLVGLRKERPRFGRFSFNEKFEYWAVFWGVPVMGLSGIALWGMPVLTEWLSGRAMNFAFIIHSDEAFLAFIYIATIHMFSVIFAPGVFPLSLGTLSGQAPATEIAERHRGELEHLADEVEAAIPADAAPPTGWARVTHVSTSLLRRVYSVGIAVAYGGVAFVALRFLILLLVSRQAAPVEIVDIPKRLDADAFFSATMIDAAQGKRGEHRVRAPLAHFHQVPQWFQPDPQNSCTTSGCHTPLPHGNRIEVRAFLNMHATFVDCQMCHATGDRAGAAAKWVSLPERTPTMTPAILRLAAKLNGLGDLSQVNAEAVNAELIELLEAALPAAGHHEQLEDWLLRLQTTHPRSRVWRRTVAAIREKIHLHVRGEYGAKIALYAGNQPYAGADQAVRDASRAFARGGETLSAAQREELLGTVHARVLPVGAMCTPCHNAEPTLMDAAALGYPAERVDALRNNAIVRMVLSIEQGQPFYLPIDQGEEAATGQTE